MSSESQYVSSVVESILVNNYLALIGVSIVAFDYILTLPREIEYVWRRRWDWVSTMFVLVRYPGICWAMINALMGTSFIPGPVEMYVRQYAVLLSIGMIYGRPKGSVLYLVSCWAFPMFICAADLVMILRVYAMWGRSRVILYALLVVYVVQVVVSVVFPALYNSSTANYIVSTAQFLDYTFCQGTFGPSVPKHQCLYVAIPRFILSVMLLVLASTQTLKQLVEMYSATSQFQLNQYMSRFMRDGIFYFFVNTLYNVLVTVITEPLFISSVLLTLSMTLLCCAMPRFFISVRELHDRDLRTQALGIDTGFGIYSSGGEVSGIAFVQEHGRETEGDTDELDIPLEAVGKTHHDPV